MKNLILLSINLLFVFSNAICQNCTYVEDSITSYFRYVELDTSLIQGNNFALLGEVKDGNKSYFRFEKESNTNISFIKIYRENSEKKILIEMPIQLDILTVKNKEISFFGQHSKHFFNFLIIKKDNQFLYIIPYGSQINNIMDCIQKYDNNLHLFVKNILYIRNSLK